MGYLYITAFVTSFWIMQGWLHNSSLIPASEFRRR